MTINSWVVKHFSHNISIFFKSISEKKTYTLDLLVLWILGRSSMA